MEYHETTDAQWLQDQDDQAWIQEAMEAHEWEHHIKPNLEQAAFPATLIEQIRQALYPHPFKAFKYEPHA